MLLIAIFSTDAFSAHHTSAFIYPILRWLGLRGAELEFWHKVIRKAAHLSAYGVLSWFAFRSWRQTLLKPEPWRVRWTLLALGLCLLTAAADEFHQAFVPSRGASVKDVMYDMTGAGIAQVFLFLLRKDAEDKPKGVEEAA